MTGVLPQALPPPGSLTCPDTGAEPFIPRWIRLFYRPTDGRSVLSLTELGESSRFTQLYEQLMTPGANLLVRSVQTGSAGQVRRGGGAGHVGPDKESGQVSPYSYLMIYLDKYIL